MKVRYMKVSRNEQGKPQIGYLDVLSSHVYVTKPGPDHPPPPAYRYPNEESLRRAGWRLGTFLI